MTNPVMTLVPVMAFLALLLAVGFIANRSLRKSEDFERDYFIANRSLGGVVLAMTLVATYGSVSSFVSGPGVAWNLGFGWVPASRRRREETRGARAPHGFPHDHRYPP